ncbi:MAG: tRNA N6-adenosine threonylcarbamoyltransferase [Microgenomates bacterium OLB23]|nr:MAG: tRNA N6-adenosine threonylcarbamoyltransferase [Microgenomates bacterium OLB23]
MHKQYGGVVPDIARRNHEEHIDEVVQKSFKNLLALQCLVLMRWLLPMVLGLQLPLVWVLIKLKNLQLNIKKPLIPVNHMEGHIYACLAENSKGTPHKSILFPCLAVLVSGGHTELVYMKDHCAYEVIGKKRDDAAGEALDKAARIILNEHIYPGGPVIEELALKGDENYLKLPVPMLHSKDLDFSYSGIKTALLYAVQEMGDEARIEHMSDLAASFQRTVFAGIDLKLKAALDQYKVASILVGGGVGANKYMRNMLRRTAKKK